MGARKSQGSASERHGMVKTKKLVKTKKQACASEGYGILKAKKAALAAVRLLRFECVPGGMDMWMDHWLETKAKAVEEAAAARPVKKRKRVLKQRLPKALIDLMVARPFRSIQDLTPAQLSKRSHDFRQLYALATFVDAKVRDYEQALIHQYNAQGYAEDEIEEDVTVVN